MVRQRILVKDGLRNRIAEYSRSRSIHTAYQLAQECGLKSTTAYRIWDNPEIFPTRQTQAKLCERFQCQPGEFTFWDSAWGGKS
ncbi:MAG: helix-turn-helix transcriptional regulator [Cyanobacteria bacterium P01_H01_bin.15]